MSTKKQVEKEPAKQEQPEKKQAEQPVQSEQPKQEQVSTETTDLQPVKE